VGYGSLLAANNGALRGLGAVATLGEITCLVAALVLLPAAMRLVVRRSAPAVSSHDVAATASAAEM
jgi:predicted RND superfamily exporter protein